jgi:chemosensory pili system protein ChpA (sensor histidine kinase/response regulator)
MDQTTSTTALESLQQLIECLQTDSGSEPYSISEQMNQLADLFHDQGMPGCGDLLALLAEQIEAEQGAALSPAQAESVLHQLGLILNADTPKSLLEYVQQAPSTAIWDSPLDPQDLELLPQLLEEEWPRLRRFAAPLETAATIEAQAGMDCCTPSERLLNCFEHADDPEALAEGLAELSETLAADSPVLADLIALAAERVEGIETLHATPVLELQSALQQLLQHPDQQRAISVLDLLLDPRWPEPLDSSEQKDQLELIQETLPAAPDGPENHTQADADPFIDEHRSGDRFCEVDMSLLEQDGPAVDPGIMAMLTSSLQALELQWQQPPSDTMALLETSLDALQPLSRACATVNLTGAQLLLQGLGANLHLFRQHPEQFFDYNRTHFAHCLSALHRHLDAPADKLIREDLIDCLSDDCLPIHTDPQQAAFISGLLALTSLRSPDQIELQTATADDIDLSTGDEIDLQLMDMLCAELPLLVDEFQLQLQAVISDRDVNGLLGAQRAAHTIKGLANMAGIRGLANLTHHLEDILEVLTDTSTLPGEQLSQDLTDAADCLAQMSEAVTEGGQLPETALTQLQQLMNWFFRLQTEGVECASAALDDAERHRRREQAEFQAAEPPLNTPAQQESRDNNQIRVPVGILDNLFRITGESSTLNAQLDDSLLQLRRLTRSNRDRQRVLQTVMFDLEQQLHDHFTLTPSMQEGDTDFDPLEMDRYHDMHATLSQLQEAVADVREVDHQTAQQLRQLTELHVAQANLQKESLENVLNTRLVPVRSITSRMQRIMRQACRASGKQARLVIEGEGVMMDSQILNQLADPLMHIIRNAVDHGLETPHMRFEAGKDETGTLKISFSQRQSKVQVSCEDDGAGINLQRVREIAERKQLIEPSSVLSDAEIQRLILVPGFSTRDEISQLSGRGIGMDVVYQQVSRMQGTLTIHSQTGKGTRFDLSMPASSLLVHTLLVRSGNGKIHALSSHSISKNLLSLDGQLQTHNERPVFVTADAEYPAYTLEGLTGEAVPDYAAMRIHPVVLVQLDQDEEAAVFVPEILAHREQVFKSMGEHIPDIPGIPGVTILANGEIAPIIDLQARVRHRHSVLATALESPDANLDLHLPRLLVVDDSLSARKTLETLLSDSGYDVTTAIDGLDALDKVRANPPDMILTDLEMPRMSGMELAAIVRNSQNFNDIPIIMITSRSTRKHRGEAEAAGVSAYLTKPWTEAAVLEQVQQLLF